MGNHHSRDRHVQPMRQSPDAEADPVPGATQQPEPELEKTDPAWQAEASESIAIKGGRDASRQGREAPAAATGRLDAKFTSRSNRWNQAQSEHSSQRMELHHRIDTLGHNMGHVQESAQEFMDIVAGAKFPKDVRRQLKNAHSTLRSDVEAFKAQKQSVISLLTDLRDSDMKLDEAGHALQKVTEAALRMLHHATLADDDVMSIVSIASTPVTEHDETESATEQLSEELQKYYDSAIQVRFMQERLDDLYTEKAEQLTRRDLVREQDGKLDETDEEFERVWEEDLSPARQNLDVAVADLKAALKACREADIDVPAWDPEIAPFSTRSSSPALHDKAQLSDLVTRPAIVGSRSSFASSNDHPQVKQTVERWVVGVEPSVDAIPPTTALHPEQRSRSLPPFGIKPPSEPGGAASDYREASAIRAVNSDQCLRNQSLLVENEEHGDAASAVPALTSQVEDAEFQKQDSPSSFFTRGKVFSTLLTRPKAQDQHLESNASDLSISAAHGDARSMVRHFVVIREREGFCNTLEILTHSGNEESQLRDNNEGFVYTNYGPHRPIDNASDAQRTGIWITLDSPEYTLHPTSRVNYAQLVNIDHGLRVKSCGAMDDHSLSILLRQWKQVSIQMYRSNPEAIAKAVQQPSPQSLSNLDFTPTQVNAILKVIDDGAEPRSAIAKVARSNTVGQLGSEALADKASDLVSEGLGYSADVSRVRHRDMQAGTSEVPEFDQTPGGARPNHLDVDDEICADDDKALDIWLSITRLVRGIFRDSTPNDCSPYQAWPTEPQQDIDLTFIYTMLFGV